MVNQDIVLRLLAGIEGFVSDLRNADDITHDRFLRDIRLQRFVERTLHLAVEACMDVAHHIISDEKWRDPDSYADAFVILAENGVLTAEQAKQFSMMARFRNKIVHYYEKVEPDLVFGIFKTRLQDFDVFVAAIRDWLARREGRG